MKKARLWSAGIFLATLGWITVQTTRSVADDDDKEIRDALLKIAAAIKSGGEAGAKKQAAALAKKIEEINEVMDYMSSRKFDKKKKKYVGGLGVGEKPGTIEPDGIELMVIHLDEKGLGDALAKEKPALKQMTYVIAAISEVAIAKGWSPNKGKKNNTRSEEHTSELQSLRHLVC